MDYLRVEAASQFANLPSSRAVSDVSKDFVVLMQGMANFVYRLLLGQYQLTLLHSLRLKEETHFIGGLQEVFAQTVS